MAIVRRAVGRATVPVVDAPFAGAPVAGGPVAGAPAIPHQPVVAAQEAAASVTTPPPMPWAVLVGFGLTALGGFGAWGITMTAQPNPFPASGATSVFGALFVFAAAVERLIEPLTRWMPGREAQARYERAMADMDNGVPGAISAAAHFKAAAEQARSARAVIMWGIATALATLLSASAGFYLLHMVSSDPGWHGVSSWVDALVTGLVVGSGTKPLHDLFTRVQQSST
jgi:hypothetical protein